MINTNNLPSLSVIMPCLNEADNVADAIEQTLAAFDALEITAEIIVINDGSRDATPNIVKQLQQQDSRIQLLNHDKPQGIGASFKDGVEHAQYDFVTMIPGDNENDAEDVLRYYHLSRQVDIIVPFIMNLEIRSKSRRFISALYRYIINISFGMNLNYTNGTVIYNRAVLLDVKLKTTGFLYQAELLIKLIRMGYFYAETPHLLSKRVSGKTKAIRFSSLLNVIKGYLSLVWEIHFTHQAGRTEVILNQHSVSKRYYSNNQ